MIEKYVGYWNTGQFDDIHDFLCVGFEIRTTPDFEPESGNEIVNKGMSIVHFGDVLVPDEAHFNVKPVRFLKT